MTLFTILRHVNCLRTAIKKNSMLHDYMIMGKNEEREEACLIENRFLKFLFASHQVGGTSVLFRLWS